MENSIASFWIDLLSLLFALIGGCWALYQWRENNKHKRAKLVRDAFEVIRCDKDMIMVLDSIDYGDLWYNRNTIENYQLSAKYDKAFAYFDYLIYLKKQGFLGKSEFQPYQYKIYRMASNQSCQDYFFNLYHFAKKCGTKMSFDYLLSYLKELNLLKDGFDDVNSENFHVLLNIR